MPEEKYRKLSITWYFMIMVDLLENVYWLLSYRAYKVMINNHQ